MLLNTSSQNSGDPSDRGWMKRRSRPLSLTKITDDGWRATFHSHSALSADAFATDDKPWRAVRRGRRSPSDGPRQRRTECRDEATRSGSGCGLSRPLYAVRASVTFCDTITVEKRRRRA
jgi:hypothetical protein